MSYPPYYKHMLTEEKLVSYYSDYYQLTEGVENSAPSSNNPQWRIEALEIFPKLL